MLAQADLKNSVSYDPETGIFVRLSTGKNPARLRRDGYLDFRIGSDSKRYLAHRLAWLYVYGEWPQFFLDHINRNKADNRIANLRDLTRGENYRNRPLFKNNTSGLAGVYWRSAKRRWQAVAQKHGSPVDLGTHKDWFEAVCARKAWEARNPIGA